jgi:hypothetical protein
MAFGLVLSLNKDWVLNHRSPGYMKPEILILKLVWHIKPEKMGVHGYALPSNGYTFVYDIRIEQSLKQKLNKEVA